MLDQMAIIHTAVRERTLPKAKLLLFISLFLTPATGLYAQDHFKESLESAQRLFAGGKDEEARLALRSLIHEVESARAPLTRKQPLEATNQEKTSLERYCQILASAHNFLGLIAARHE